MVYANSILRGVEQAMTAVSRGIAVAAIWCACLTLAASDVVLPTPKPSLHCVFIGIDDYSPPIPDLLSATRDASALAEATKQNSSHFGKHHVTLLLNKDATQAGVENALARAATASQQDTVFISFSGNAVQLANEAVLLLSDYAGGKIPSETDKGVLTATRLAKHLALIRAKNLFIVIDACTTSGFSKVAEMERASRGQASLDFERNMIILAHQGLAFEDQEGGALSRAIVEAMQGEGVVANADGLLGAQMIAAGATQRANWQVASSSVRNYSTGADFPLAKVASTGRDNLKSNYASKIAPPPASTLRDGSDYFISFVCESFDGSWRALGNPRIDADRLQTTLEGSFGFTTLGIHTIDTEISLLEPLTKLLNRQWKPHDQLLIHISSHGEPTDFGGVVVAKETTKVGNFLKNAVRHDDIRTLLFQLHGKHRLRILLILDTCYAGLVASPLGENPFKSGPYLNDKIIHATLQKSTVALLCSSSETERVPDGVKGEGSAFANVLNGILSGAAAAGESIGVAEVHERLKQAFAAATPQTERSLRLMSAGIQTELAGDQGGEFLFILKTKD
jgi:hypothetical protein